jgi:hypothetical protein
MGIQTGVRFHSSESGPLAGSLVLLRLEVAKNADEAEIDEADRRTRVFLTQSDEDVRGLQIPMDEAEVV